MHTTDAYSRTTRPRAARRRIARTPIVATAGLLGGALLALGAPLAASAHVTVSPSETAAGSYAVLTFAFGHGCDGSPTTALTFDIPESIESVSPTLNPNWTIEKVADGDRTAQVVYTAVTPVADGYRDTVELSLQLPEDAAGETLAFPVLQSCAEGETNWSELAEDGAAEPEHPAPVVVVTEATGGDGHGAAAGSGEHGEQGAHDEAAQASDAAASSSDVVARVLGIGGLVVGVVGVVLALAARRPRSDA